MNKKKSYTALFKTEVALVTIKGDLTQAQISSKYELHSTQIIKWKKLAVEAIKLIFSGKLSPDKYNTP